MDGMDPPSRIYRGRNGFDSWVIVVEGDESDGIDGIAILWPQVPERVDDVAGEGG